MLCSLVLAGLPLAAAAQLSGSYTIGGASPDFASFGAATTALASQGVAGPVDFLVRAGTYTEAGGNAPVLVLSANVPGASTTNRITFRPDAATGATVDDVVLERSNAPGGFGAYLVDLRADWVGLRELTLRAGDTTSTSFTHGSFVSIEANNGERRGVEIVDCVLESRSLANVAVVGLGGSFATHRDHRIAGNRFHDFVRGIQVGGFASSYTDLTIEGNQFTGMRDRNTAQGDPIGVAVNFEIFGVRPVVRGNRLDYAGGGGVTGINFIAQANDFRVEGNEIYNVFDGANAVFDAFTGIRISSANGANSSGRITNNMISVYTARRSGIEVNGTNGVLVAHNTVYLPERGIDFFGGSQALLVCASNLVVVGNVLVDLGTGTNNRTNAIFQQGCANTNNLFDGNLLFNEQGALAWSAAGAPVSNLEAWQALGNGASSVSFLPEVVNVFDDLHLTGCTAGDPALEGLPLAEVTLDIDGRARDATTPTMGAHESLGEFPALFGEPALYEPFAASLGTPLYLDAADLDGDDDVDLVVSLTGAWRGLGLLANQGDGSFAPMTPIDLNAMGPGGGFAPLVVKAADIDGDGSVDLAVARELSTSFEVYWGTGGGGFSAPTVHPTASPLSTIREGISDFELTDLDGDGLLDFVYSDVGLPSVSGVDGDVGVRCNTTGRSFFDPWGEGAFPAPLNPWDLVVGDLDGDLAPDLLVSNLSQPGTLRMLRSTGGACPGFVTFETHNHYSTIDSAPLLPHMTIADLDGDGLADVVADDEFTPGPGIQNLPLFFNLGDFDLAVEETLVDTNPQRAPGALVALDYEGDGATDLLVGNESGELEGPGQLVLLRNDGTGTFTPALACGPSTLPREPRQLVSADFDGDGRPDLAAVMEGEREIAVVLQPVPEPGLLAGLAAGAMALLAGAGRRGAARGLVASRESHSHSHSAR